MSDRRGAWISRWFVPRLLVFVVLIFLASEVRHAYQASPENVALAVLQVGQPDCFDTQQGECLDSNGDPIGGITPEECLVPPCPVGGPPCGDPSCEDEIPELPFETEDNNEPAPEECGAGDPNNTLSDPVNLFSGEFTLDVTDMVIPGRGFDFVLKRKYRSRTFSLLDVGNLGVSLKPSAIMGYNWDMSYNIFLVSAGNTLVFHDGTGRSDKFTLITGSTNTYGREEYFRTITKNLDDSFTMLHADGTRWDFAQMNNMGTTSKITAIIDRNGNTMRFEYEDVTDTDGNSAQGLLTTIYDTLDHTTSPGGGTIGPWIPLDPSEPAGSTGLPGPQQLILSDPLVLLRRAIAFDYTNGLLTSVTDWTGRIVTYGYDANLDLVSVATPTVAGTPNNNDFLSGKTTTYTYSQSQDDPSTTNGQSYCLGYEWKCQYFEEQPNPIDVVYGYSLCSPSQNPPGPPPSAYPAWCCKWVCRMGSGGEPDTVQVDVTYGQLIHNLLTITDAKGELILQNSYSPSLSGDDPLFDHIVSQEYGGDTYSFTYVTFGQPDGEGVLRKTAVINRMGQKKELSYDSRNRLVKRLDFTGFFGNPLVGKLRGGDPAFFETRYEYNDDSRKTKITHSNGNFETFVYAVDNDPDIDPRFRGNLVSHIWHRGSEAGDQETITESFTYETGLGGCCGFNFVKTHTDGRKNDPNETVTLNDTVHEYDVDGNRTKTTHRDGGIEEWTYNGYGQMTTHTLPDNGNGHRRITLSIYYPSSDQQFGYLKERRVDHGGLSLTTAYEYDDVGNLTKRTDPRGNATDYVVNELNQVVRVLSRIDVNGDRYQRDTYYDLNDNVVRVDIDNLDEAGNPIGGDGTLTTTYDYDVLNFMTRKTEEVDASRSIDTEYGYNKNKKLIHIAYGEATGGDGDSATTGAQPTNTIDREYDERDLLFKEIRAQGDADESTTQYDYDKNKNLTLIKQGIIENTSPTHVTTNIYDGYDRLVESDDALYNRTFYHYDANHNRISSLVTGEIGNASPPGVLSDATYTYDSMDRMTQRDVAVIWGGGLPLPDGPSTTQATYSKNSQILSVIDDGGDTTTVEYDTANRRSVITDAAGNKITYTYDESSNVTSIQEDDLHDIFRYFETFTTVYAYDSLERLISTTDNVLNVNTFDYDSRNNRVLMTDALSNETRYVYDGLNRLVETMRDMNGNGANAGDAADIVTTQTWDDSSRLITRTDDNGNETVYEYDPLGRMTAEVFADCTETRYVYDIHHNPITITDANDSVITCTYDQLNRLRLRIIAPGPGVADASNGGTTFETFGWDGLSRLVGATDNDSLVEIWQDSLSNVIRDRQVIPSGPGASSGIVTATFDGESNMLSCTYPGGRKIGYSYDILDRIQTITDDTGVGQGQSGLLIASYVYVGGRVSWRDYGNNTRMDYAYDGVSNQPGDFGVRQVIGTTHSDVGGSIIDERTYTWDEMYNKKQRADIRAPSTGQRLTHDYDYDRAYRMIQATATDTVGSPAIVRATTYNLDGVHNRISTSGTVGGILDPATGNYTMDDTTDCTDLAMNKYTTTPLDRRSYDANGSLTRILDNDGSGNALAISCLYDYRNRMVEYLDSTTGQRHTYAYDALGRRIAKTVDAGGASPVTTRYFYGGVSQWQVCEEQIALSQFPWIATTATYVYGRYIDEVLQMQRCEDQVGFPPCDSVTPVDYYYHTDDMYDVMAVTDENGAVVERYEYGDYGTPTFMDAAGNILTQPDGTPRTSSAIANPYQFTGRRYDPESGWYNYRTRYLDPKTGKFTTRDVIGIWGDPGEFGNGYTYVENNPLSWLDSYGLQTTRPSFDRRIKKIKEEQLVDLNNALAEHWDRQRAMALIELIAKAQHAAAIGKSLTAAISGGINAWEFSNAFNTATDHFNKHVSAYINWKFLQALYLDYDDIRVDERGFGTMVFYGGKTCGTCNFLCLCGPGGNDRPFIMCAGGFSKCSGPGHFKNPRQNKCTTFCNKKRRQQKEKEKQKEEEEGSCN